MRIGAEAGSFSGMMKKLSKNIRQQETYDISQRIRMHIEENYADLSFLCHPLQIVSVFPKSISPVCLNRLLSRIFPNMWERIADAEGKRIDG